MEYVLSIIGIPERSLKRSLSPLGNFALHIKDHFIPHARNNYHPHILGHRTLALFSGLLVSVKIFTLVLLAFGPVVPVFSSAITSSNIISLTNESRTQFGLGELKENSLLAKAAQAKADDMLARGYFAHNTPDGKTPWDFIVNAGYSYLQAGENLAVNFSEAEDVESAWMNSPGHKANILNKNFEEIGIGIAQGMYQGHEAIFVVQEFGTPAFQKVALREKPTEVKPTSVPAPSKEAFIPVKNSETQAQIRGDSSSAPTPQEALAVLDGKVNLLGQNVGVEVKMTGPAVKVIAYFGGQAVMLSPKEGNEWKAEVLVSQIAGVNHSVKIMAYDINGQLAELKLADFSPNTIENYNLAGTQASKNISFLGLSFDPKAVEMNFYMLFIAGILTSLVVAVAVKKHIQHLSLVANSSFVVMFATLLWWVR